MRSLLVLLFIHAVWAEYNATEELTDWHQKVGIQNAARIKLAEERIVGGAIAPVYAHPYLAGLLMDVGMPSPSACGGSILTQTRVLTAAHCWNDGRLVARSITVVFGTPYLFHGGLRIFAQQIAVHPLYDTRTFANDIAMLYMPVAVPFSAMIQPISLASGSLLNTDFTNVLVTASGYGRYSDVNNPTTNTMTRNVMLQVMSNDQCRMFYGDNVRETNICTYGNGGVGICQGDSGGPLTIDIQGQPVLIGVSSFVARDGCELHYPSAFSRVSSYIDWILLQL